MGSDDNECADLFKEYKSCLSVSLSWVLWFSFYVPRDELTRVKVALKKRGIDKLLDEAKEDNKETDQVLMGRKRE